MWAVLGGFLCVVFPKMVRWHLPVVAWGLLVLCLDLPCPLTALEDHLRTLGGGAAYQNGFLPYVMTLVRPDDAAAVSFHVLAWQLLIITCVTYMLTGARPCIDRLLRSILLPTLGSRRLCQNRRTFVHYLADRTGR